ncbi:delta-aminolevulinic acid dehydratase-like [Ornithodoros turicata]|uniref:delta-aminolevulinic acid dehydratase-like n=1 Tax=Ornithodoros turicata TaxID=34597 RepID=UPI003138DF62
MSGEEAVFPMEARQNALKAYLHSGYSHVLLRQWHETGVQIDSKSFMYPVFVLDDPSGTAEIADLPGVNQYSVNSLEEHLEPLVRKGLSSVLLFGVITKLTKDSNANVMDCAESPVLRAINMLTVAFPKLLIACDVCLCPYTDHGQCGIYDKDGYLDRTSTTKRLTEVAVAFGRAGCHVVVPSDVQDCCVGPIKEALFNAGLGTSVSVLCCSAKFSSCFYGPLRDFEKTKNADSDAKCCQLPSGSVPLALRAVERDTKEGADMLMVKPGLPYLDVICRIKDRYPGYPLFVYQSAGEYSMLWHAACKGTFDLHLAVLEAVKSFRRAGADVIMTYFTPQLLDWLQK